MKRQLDNLLCGAAVVLLALLTIGSSSAFAKAKKCMVINDRINTTYMSETAVQDAVDEASPGDTIWIRGGCNGPVEIAKSLTLQGQDIPGFSVAPEITRRTADQLSVVWVHGSGIQVRIDGLRLTYGGSWWSAVRGGGILNEQAELILNNVTITNNFARDGGGIYNDGGTVELIDSTVHSNMARFGRGGGIFSRNGTVILESSTILDNQLAEFGGGIFALSSTVIVKNSEIAYNYYPEPYSDLSVTGGGIYMDREESDDPWNTLVLTDTRIHHHYAGESGGGIFAVSANVTLAGSSELSWNHADNYGGGALVVGNLVLSGDTSIHDNTTGNPYKSGELGRGGGVAWDAACSSCSFTMSENATIYGNLAGVEGGGIFSWSPVSSLIGCLPGENVFDNEPDNISW